MMNKHQNNEIDVAALALDVLGENDLNEVEARQAKNERYHSSESYSVAQAHTGGGGVSSLPAQPEKTALDGQFKNPPRDTLQAHQDSLSGWQRFLFNRKVGKLRSEQAFKISKTLYKSEFEAVLQKITLSLDIEKKRTFANYLRSTNSLQRELQQLDAAASLSLSQSLMDISVRIHEARNGNEQTVENLRRRGVINQKQAADLQKTNDELCERNLKGALTTLDHMWNNHKKLLEQTLRVSLDELIVKGRL